MLLNPALELRSILTLIRSVLLLLSHYVPSHLASAFTILLLALAGSDNSAAPQTIKKTLCGPSVLVEVLLLWMFPCAACGGALARVLLDDVDSFTSKFLGNFLCE
jgi:hypothetical protein